MKILKDVRRFGEPEEPKCIINRPGFRNSGGGVPSPFCMLKGQAKNAVNRNKNCICSMATDQHPGEQCRIEKDEEESVEDYLVPKAIYGREI